MSNLPKVRWFGAQATLWADSASGASARREQDREGERDGGCAEDTRALAEYEEINNKFGLEEYYGDPDKMDKLMQRQAEVQDIIDATDAWNIDPSWNVPWALHCPPGTGP